MRSTSRQSPSTAAVASASPALCVAHGCCSSMYAFASRISCHTAPNASSNARSANAASIASSAAAACAASGPSARASGTTPPQYDTAMFSTRLARLPKLLARSAL